MNFFHILKSDFLKMKRTSFYYMHLGFPIIGAIVSLIYFKNSEQPPSMILWCFLEEVLLIFPIIVGVVSAMVIEQEMKAGRFREMLCSKYGREIHLSSKVCFLILMGAFSYILTVVLFSTGFTLLSGKELLPSLDIFKLCIITYLPIIVLYLFHIFLSIRFGLGMSIGVGIFEFLVEALFITGLGDGIWFLVPCSMPSRMNGLFITIVTDTVGNTTFIGEYHFGLYGCMIYLVLITILLFLWFHYFEGRTQVE